MKINDIVTVFDKGCTYTSYTEMAAKLGITHKWAYGDLPKQDGIYRIAATEPHLDAYSKHTILVAIEDGATGKCYIIGEKGLRLKQEYVFLDDKEFLL